MRAGYHRPSNQDNQKSKKRIRGPNLTLYSCTGRKSHLCFFIGSDCLYPYILVNSNTNSGCTIGRRWRWENSHPRPLTRTRRAGNNKIVLSTSLPRHLGIYLDQTPFDLVSASSPSPGTHIHFNSSHSLGAGDPSILIPSPPSYLVFTRHVQNDHSLALLRNRFPVVWHAQRPGVDPGLQQGVRDGLEQVRRRHDRARHLWLDSQQYAPVGGSLRRRGRSDCLSTGLVSCSLHLFICP